MTRRLVRTRTHLHHHEGPPTTRHAHTHTHTHTHTHIRSRTETSHARHWSHVCGHLARPRRPKPLTPVGFEPTQPARVELESTPLDHSGKVSFSKGTLEPAKHFNTLFT